MVSEDAQRILRNIHYINTRHPDKIKGDVQLSSGANIMKRKVLWSWQEGRTLSESKVCDILVSLGVASGQDEARSFVRNLDDLHIDYKEGSWLNVQRIKGSSGISYRFDLYFPE